MARIKISPKLKILSKEDVYEIHIATLEVLEQVGVKVQDEELLNLLAANGATIDHASQIAKIPPYLVMEAVRKMPRRHIIYARNPKDNVRVGYGESRFVSVGGEIYYVDPIEKTRRDGILKDMVNAIRLGDALPNINLVGAMIVPRDIHIRLVELHTFSQLIKNTSKPPFGWIYSAEAARNVLKMFSILAGGEEELKKKPMIWYWCEPTSPLKFGANTLAIMKEFTKFKAPILIGPMVQAGASGPITMAGTLVVENAEILAGNLITQLLNPGNPVRYGGQPHILDQKVANISFGSPEQGVMAAAMTQVGRYYGFPVFVDCGYTDSKLPDAQAGVEKGMTILMGALAGAEEYGSFGIAGADMGTCFEQLVIDNEMADYLMAIIKGIEVDEDRLALDIIERVGIGGSYLTQKHTLQRVRTEFWYPSLFDRKVWDTWQKEGSKDTLRKAREEVDKILATHQPEPLDKDLERNIDDIVKIATKRANQDK